MFGWFLFGYAARRDAEWAVFQAQARDEELLNQIALAGAGLTAARFNAVASEFNEESTENHL
jgi:hypothetical protein